MRIKPSASKCYNENVLWLPLLAAKPKIDLKDILINKYTRV
jgi:hypothetical protein